MAGVMSLRKMCFFPNSCYVFREILLPNPRILLKVGDSPHTQWGMAGFGKRGKEATL